MPQLSTRLAKLIFISTACVLLILSYILYLQVKDLIASYNQVNQANVVKLKLEQTLTTITDAETAQRGFLLTNDSIFLQPYKGAYERSKGLLSELRTLTAHNPEQQKNLNALSTFVEIRFRSFNTVIDQYNLPGISQETKKSHLLKSKSSMDSIRFHVSAIENIEEGLMLQQEKIKRKHSYLAPFYAFLLILTSLGILLFSYNKVVKQLNRSKRLLSKLRKLNGKLKEKNEELELYNKELDSFTYIASHDLKEPLRKILTFSALIEDTEAQNLSDRNKLHFKRIQHSVKRMQNLLDDLLLYSHASKMSIEFENVDLNKIIHVVEQSLMEEIKEAHAEIKKGQLPIVRGLPFQLKQLFENLVINSLKYKQDNLHPDISIESSLINKKDIKLKFYKKSDNYHKILFRDNGLGFEQTYAEKVFQLFQRVHTTEKHSGTGIGLTICKKVVQNHNGYIKANSQVNSGTTFEIYLPA